MNLIDGAKVLIICEISLHISSQLVQNASIGAELGLGIVVQNVLSVLKVTPQIW